MNKLWIYRGRRVLGSEMKRLAYRGFAVLPLLWKLGVISIVPSEGV